jgi:hypothetical protein
MRVDRVVVDRDCVVAFSCSVENARPTALGDEVPRRVDVAVGPSFRGAHKPYSLPSLPSNPQPRLFPFFLSLHMLIDGWHPRQIIAVAAIILGAYQQNSLFFVTFLRIS